MNWTFGIKCSSLNCLQRVVTAGHCCVYTPEIYLNKVRCWRVEGCTPSSPPPPLCSCRSMARLTKSRSSRAPGSAPMTPQSHLISTASPGAGGDGVGRGEKEWVNSKKKNVGQAYSLNLVHMVENAQEPFGLRCTWAEEREPKNKSVVSTGRSTLEEPEVPAFFHVNWLKLNRNKTALSFNV